MRITGAPLLLLLFTAVAGCGQETAGPDTAAVDAAEGVYKPCAACHGVEGEGNVALNAPALVNLDGWYIKRQLGNFAAGIRGSHADDVHGRVMAAQMTQLRDTLNNASVVSQIEDFTNVQPTVTIQGDVDNGRDHYNMICGACHGPDAIGNEVLNAPSLRGIDDWYLARQYEHFRNGVRGSHEEDKYGQQMQRMGRILKTDSDVRDVIAYLNSLGIDD